MPTSVKSFCLLLLSVSLLLMSTSFVKALGNSDDYDWTLKREDGSFKIYTSKVPYSKYKAVQSQMRIKGKISSLVALIKDPNACSEWADGCKEAKITEVISDQEYYLYAYNDIPFPVKDRDILAHVRWEYLPESEQVTMQANAINRNHPPTRAVRVEKARSVWRFTPQENGYILINNIAHAEPNGPIPAWIVNMLSANSPFKTFKKLKAIVESGAYDNHVIDFLEKPQYP